MRFARMCHHQGMCLELWTDEEVQRLRSRISSNDRLYQAALNHLFERIRGVPFETIQALGNIYVAETFT